MRQYSWDSVPEEKLKDDLTRRVINGEKITLGKMWFGKGGVVPEHHHENEQFTTVTRGSMEFDVGGKKLVLKAGDVLHIPPNVPHSVVALEDCEAVDIFTPVREDWRAGTDDYIRQK